MFLSKYRHDNCSPNLVSVAKIQGLAHRLSVLDTTCRGLNINTVTNVNSLNTSIVDAMQTCYCGTDIRQLYVASKHYKLWVNTDRPRDADNAVLRSYKDAKSQLRRGQTTTV